MRLYISPIHLCTMCNPEPCLGIRDRALEGNQFQEQLAVQKFLNHTTTRSSNQPLLNDLRTIKCSALLRCARYSVVLLRRIASRKRISE